MVVSDQIENIDTAEADQIPTGVEEEGFVQSSVAEEAEEAVHNLDSAVGTGEIQAEDTADTDRVEEVVLDQMLGVGKVD